MAATMNMLLPMLNLLRMQTAGHRMAWLSVRPIASASVVGSSIRIPAGMSELFLLFSVMSASDPKLELTSPSFAVLYLNVPPFLKRMLRFPGHQI